MSLMKKVLYERYKLDSSLDKKVNTRLKGIKILLVKTN